MLHMKRSTLVYLIVNLLGLLLFIYFIHSIDALIKAEQRDYSDFGDSIKFFTTAVPVFLLCFVYSIIWGFKAGLDAYHKHDYQSLYALVIVVSAWTCSILILRNA
jgi:hypothetical protein